MSMNLDQTSDTITPSSGSLTVSGRTSATNIPTTGTVIASTTAPATNPATGTPSSTTYLRGDGTWSAVSGGVVWQAVQTTGFTATVGNAYPCNTTSSAFTVTFPASPTAGNLITISDYAGTFATNNLTINPNGNKINSDTANVVLSISRQAMNYVYIDSTQGWIAFAGIYAPTTYSYVANYVVVAGGGGGAGGSGGGGGAGGYRESTLSLAKGTTYTVTIGGGGSAGSSSGNGTAGTNSVFGSITSTAGGYGATNNGGAGGAGGSGGGAGIPFYSVQAGGAGTSGQGSNGGAGGTSTTNLSATGGGGGGASQTGTAGVNGTAGKGGNGTATTITGGSLTFAGGGGGAGDDRGTYTVGAGGSGGGGAGNKTGAGVAGTANTGGGGGGGNGGLSPNGGGNGGNGVVIISVPTANYSGVYTGTQLATYPKANGSNTVLYFTGSGSYTA